MAKKYKVIKDTREQLGWEFAQGSHSGFECTGMIMSTLPTGDYTLEGYEDILTIERKGKIGEFATNLTQTRFTKELERMEAFKYAYLVLEFNFWDLLNFPYSSEIPPNKWKRIKITPQFLLKRFAEISIKYKTKIIFVGDEGKKFVNSLFRRVLENESR